MARNKVLVGEGRSPLVTGTSLSGMVKEIWGKSWGEWGNEDGQARIFLGRFIIKLPYNYYPGCIYSEE